MKPKHAFPPDAHVKGGRNAAPVLEQLARDFYAPLIPLAVELRNQGLSLREIARELERRGIQARHGWTRWSAAQVRRILLRAPSIDAAGKQSEQSEPHHFPPIAAPAPTEPLPPASVAPRRDEQQAVISADRAAQSAQATPAGIFLRLGGQSKGPFSEDKVRAMLAAHQVGPGTLGRRDDPGSEWQPLQDVLSTNPAPAL